MFKHTLLVPQINQRLTRSARRFFSILCLLAAFNLRFTMKHIQIFLIIVGLLVISCCSAWSDAVPQPQLLSSSIQEATVIVFGKLEDFVPREASTNTFPKSETLKAIALSASYSSGTYTLTSVQVVKGNVQNKKALQVVLPSILSFYYGSKVNLDKGSNVLLLFNRGTNGQLVPVDATIPIIPLGFAKFPASVLASHSLQEANSLVIKLVVSTLDESAVRKVNMYLLRSVVSDYLPAKLIPLENDPDTDFRDDVLHCLIINQQVQAIPLMAKLSELRLKETGGAASVGAFENLKTREAVPYLNPLLLNVSPFTRQATAFALRRLADRTSLPFLFKALEQPDPEGITLYEEYATLHRLLSRLGTTKSLPEFLDQKEATLHATQLWWSKHQQEFHLDSSKP